MNLALKPLRKASIAVASGETPESSYDKPGRTLQIDLRYARIKFSSPRAHIQEQRLCYCVCACVCVCVCVRERERVEDTSSTPLACPVRRISVDTEQLLCVCVRVRVSVCNRSRVLVRVPLSLWTSSLT